MINRIFGWLFTLAALTSVVFAVLNRDNYSSMCFDKDCEAEEVVAVAVDEIEESVVELPDVEDGAEVDNPAIDTAAAIVQ